MTESSALVPNTVYWILYATLLFQPVATTPAFLGDRA
jgi:hypothetical protein